MNEQELRAINPEDFEGVDIKWVNDTYDNGKPYSFTGRVLYDYDMGLSILNKEDSEDCLTGYNGPASKKAFSNYENPEQYNLWLTAAFKQLRDGVYDAQLHNEDVGYAFLTGSAKCSFT